ncbi:MAG: hypothetical protein Q9216_003571 [Gyalolechia sp. 2 TL-2023]
MPAQTKKRQTLPKAQTATVTIPNDSNGSEHNPTCSLSRNTIRFIRCTTPTLHALNINDTDPPAGLIRVTAVKRVAVFSRVAPTPRVRVRLHRRREMAAVEDGPKFIFVVVRGHDFPPHWRSSDCVHAYGVCGYVEHRDGILHVMILNVNEQILLSDGLDHGQGYVVAKCLESGHSQTHGAKETWTDSPFALRTGAHIDHSEVGLVLWNGLKSSHSRPRNDQIDPDANRCGYWTLTLTGSGDQRDSSVV